MRRRPFRSFFEAATGLRKGPREYQANLAESERLPDILAVPTGCGKTAAAVLSWAWRRRECPRDEIRRLTPRRLVYCLPMRSLVEQVRDDVIGWFANLGWLERAQPSADSYRPNWSKDAVPVFRLIGGEEAVEWEGHPEREAVLVGTQDMLLSRALNRGYAMRPYYWPIAFGLVNVDALWVFDEVQLMGAGFQFMQWETVGLRAARLLHARLEATVADVDGEVHYGLVKVDGIEPESSATKKSNKGQSIAHKQRYVPVPKSIQATFEIDVLALRERSLVPVADANCADEGSSNRAAQRFLLALALWKIHRFLTNGPAFDARTGDTMGALRLRADCSLACGQVTWSGSKHGAPFGENHLLDPKSLVKPLQKDEPTGLLADPPNFEKLLKQF